MNLWRIIMKEIQHHKLMFVIGMLSVVIAVGVLVSQLTLLHAHDMQTEQILEAKQKQLEEDMKVMEDDFRKLMLQLGFNMYILPKEQQLENLYDDGYASKFMPEDYIDKLSASNIVTIRHLLPVVEQKIEWPEQGNRTMILIGIRGEVPFTVRKPKKPMLLPVPPGKIVLGHELWESLGVQVGDTVTLFGEAFEVSECHSQRGTKDDISAWVDLPTSQRLLGLEGKLSGIMALQCFCHGSDLVSLNKQIPGILAGTQVMFFQNKVTTRADSRAKAKSVAKASLEAEEQHRLQLRGELEALASWLMPLAIVASVVLVGFLAFHNVRVRRPEIGILRALGCKSGQILQLFLAKACIVGLLGAVIGIILGGIIGILSSGMSFEVQTIGTLFNIQIMLAVAAGALLLAVCASWIPAIMAAGQDPAIVLREE
jgi:ABC-type lipoprotein release transport system permease subunit